MLHCHLPLKKKKLRFENSYDIGPLRCGQRRSLTHTGGVLTSKKLKSKPPDRVVVMSWKLKKTPLKNTKKKITVRGALLHTGGRAGLKGGTWKARLIKSVRGVLHLRGFHYLWAARNKLVAWKLWRAKGWSAAGDGWACGASGGRVPDTPQGPFHTW